MTSSPAPARGEVLAVDLDGTLIRTDMLLESFWAAFSTDWKTPIVALAGLSGGRAGLKRSLAGRSSIDAQSLPYNREVLDYVARWRENGGRTALVTASDIAIAEPIARYVGLFDEVHGSDGATNLKGANKAAFLRERYGNYAYIGDAQADLPVWKDAARAITFTRSQSLRAAAQQLGPPVEHLDAGAASAKPYLKAIRPHQWLKNLLVFVPMMTAQIFNMPALLAALLAFIAFSLVASSIYVINDLLDLSADRAHPRKRSRPFASGAVPLQHGLWLFVLLLASGLAAAVAVGRIEFLLMLLAYIALTFAYSITLKRRLIVDILTLAMLYTLRIAAGAAAIGTIPSVWLMAFSIFLFLSLAAVKRQAELVDSMRIGKERASGRAYLVTDLPLVSMIGISAGYVSVLVLALYLESPLVRKLYSAPQLLWPVLLVMLYWVSRMVMIAHRGRMHDDPIVFAFRDKVSRGCGVILIVSIWLASVL